MKAPDRRIFELRRQLAHAIVGAVGPMGQYKVAPAYGIPQPRMSELNRGRVERCTMEWLIRRIHLMGGSVTLTVHVSDVSHVWARSRDKRKRQSVVPLAPYSLYGRRLDP